MRERGASLVELALILPVLALLVFGTVDVARAYRLQVRLENAAREGAAFAQIYPNDVDGCLSSPDDIEDYVLLEDSTLADPDVAVFREDGSEHEKCGVGDADAGERLRIEVSATFDVLTPLVENIVGDTLRLTGDAEVVVQGDLST